MAKEIDKIIQSKTAPKSNNVLWDDGENLKINRNGKWENISKVESNNDSLTPNVPSASLPHLVLSYAELNENPEKTAHAIKIMEHMCNSNYDLGTVSIYKASLPCIFRMVEWEEDVEYLCVGTCSAYYDCYDDTGTISVAFRPLSYQKDDEGNVIPSSIEFLRESKNLEIQNIIPV